MFKIQPVRITRGDFLVMHNFSQFDDHVNEKNAMNAWMRVGCKNLVKYLFPNIFQKGTIHWFKSSITFLTQSHLSGHKVWSKNSTNIQDESRSHCRYSPWSPPCWVIEHITTSLHIINPWNLPLSQNLLTILLSKGGRIFFLFFQHLLQLLHHVVKRLVLFFSIQLA